MHDGHKAQKNGADLDFHGQCIVFVLVLLRKAMLLFLWQNHCSTHSKFQCSLHCVECFVHCGFLWSTFCLSLHSGLYCALQIFPQTFGLESAPLERFCANDVKHIFGECLIVLLSKLGFSLAWDWAHNRRFTDLQVHWLQLDTQTITIYQYINTWTNMRLH